MRKLSRYLRALSVVSAVTITMTACSGTESDAAERSINVYLAQHSWTDTIQELIPEFENETGISVNLTTLGESQLAQQYQVMFNSGSSEADVAMIMSSVEMPRYVRNGWLADITENVTRDPDWDWADFSQTSREAVTGPEGAVRAVPLLSERFVLIYRKDLLAEAGLAVPSTFEELEYAATTLTDAAAGQYGFVTRGNASVAVPAAASFVFGYGGDWTNPSGDSAVSTSPVVDGVTYFGNLLGKYGPPGALNMGWAEATAVFQQGKVAIAAESDALFANFLDSDASSVADSVGFAAFPAGPEGHRVASYVPWSLSIPESSEKDDLAWQFIQWATSKENSRTLLSKQKPVTRESAWADEEAASAYPAEIASLIRETSDIEYVDHASPQVINISQSRDIVGSMIATAISGGDVKDASVTANSKLQALIDSEKK